MLTDLINRTLEIAAMMEQLLGALTRNRLAVVMQVWEKSVQFWGLGLLKLTGSPWSCLALPQINTGRVMIMIVVMTTPPTAGAVPPLYARHWAKCLTTMISLNPYGSPVRSVTITPVLQMSRCYKETISWTLEEQRSDLMVIEDALFLSGEGTPIPEASYTQG